jgi:hypothetical protein
MWYPTEKGEYVNLNQAISIDVEQAGSKFFIAARFSLTSKTKVILRILEDKEEAMRLREWIIRELNKQG